MKKIGDIMAEMGFRKDAPDSLKEAFIRHLIKSSTGADMPARTQEPEKKTELEKMKPLSEPEQLAFNFSLGRSLDNKKASSF